MMARDVFIVPDQPLPPIELPPEFATKRWKVRCNCGYVGSGRSELTVNTASLEHWACVHVVPDQ